MTLFNFTKNDMRYILVGLCLAIIMSCGSQNNDRDLLSGITKNINAIRYDIVDLSSDNGKMSKNMTEISFFVEDVLTDSTKECCTSMAALTLFQAHNNKMKNIGDTISVIVNDGNGIFNKKYKVLELQKIGTCIDNVTKVLENTDNKIKDYSIIDTSIISPAFIDKFEVSLDKVKSQYGYVINSKVTKFRFSNSLDNSFGERVLVLWINLEYSKAVSDMTFIVSLKTFKIIYIGMNDDSYK